MKSISFLCKDEFINFSYDKVFIVGYSGRDIEKTKEHIDELERELGVKPPSKIPTIFECSKENVTQDEDLKFVGQKTSGEAEYVILKDKDEIYITIGSDHTDRALESISIYKSKQVALKPIGKEVWKFNDIKEHFDEIKLNSKQVINGKEVEYQKGKLKDILPVETIIEELTKRVGNIDNAIIFSGTVPLHDGFKFGEKFLAEMIDEKLNRKLRLEYNIEIIKEEEK